MAAPSGSTPTAGCSIRTSLSVNFPRSSEENRWLAETPAATAALRSCCVRFVVVDDTAGTVAVDDRFELGQEIVVVRGVETLGRPVPHRLSGAPGDNQRAEVESIEHCRVVRRSDKLFVIG